MKLVITIKEARDLPAADKNGMSDPFCVLEYSSTNRSKPKEYKTKIVKKSLNPIWNEIIEISQYMDGDLFVFTVFDHDTFGKSDKLSSVSLGLDWFKSCVLAGKSSEWVALNPKGGINLSFYFDPVLSTESLAAGASPIPQPQLTSSGVTSVVNYTVLQVTQAPRLFIPIFVEKEDYIYVSSQGKKLDTVTFVTGTDCFATLYYIVSGLFADVRSIWVTFSGHSRSGSGKAKKIVSTSFNLVPEGTKLRLERGKHAFPFSFHLPKHCHTVFSQGNHSVSYSLVVEADVANLENESFRSNVKVVNLEQTPYGRVPRPVQQTNIKKTLAGKNISMKASIAKDFYLPLEDIELTVEVENTSAKKMKKVDLSLFAKAKGTGSQDTDGLTQVGSTKKLRFYRKILPGTTGKTTFIYELPKVIHHSFVTANTSLEYYMKVVLDIPNAVDIDISLPLTIVIPDPQVPVPITLLDEVAKLSAIVPEQWTSHHVNMWVQGSDLNISQYLPAFQTFDLTGEEMLSLVSFRNPRGREGVQVLAGGPADQLFNAIYSLIAGKEQLAVFLKKVGLAKYIKKFEEQEITWDIAHLLKETDLSFLPVGPRVKFYAALKK